MRRSTITTLAIVAIIIAVAALFFATRKIAVAPASSPSPSPTATHPATSNVPSPSATSNPTAAVLKYTDSGFSPASVTVTAGQQLTIQNTSTKAIQIDSNPHPAHTDDPELNFGPIAAGSSATVTLNKTGTFGIHNHLDPSVQATVTIK